MFLLLLHAGGDTALVRGRDGGLVIGICLLDGCLRTGLVNRQRRLPRALARDGPLKALKRLG